MFGQNTLIATAKVQTYCFADNLEWLSFDPETHDQTYDRNSCFPEKFSPNNFHEKELGMRNM